MTPRSRDTVIAGYIPLLDSALLVAAARLGFADEQGIDLRLVRETSWANIRDRISVGHFDVAHMLGPMPIAASLNITSLAVPMRAAMALGLGGNAITVCSTLWEEMRQSGSAENGGAKATAMALAKVVAERAASGGPRLRFGVVHPFSGHAYELRYWMAGAGIHPDRDVEITVLPPTLMPDALKVGQIDGYCVGEPWNTMSVMTGDGRIVTIKEAIWPASPEKVLGVADTWAERNPDLLDRLIRALVKSAEWCGTAENAPKLAALLSSAEFVDCPSETCLPALTGRLMLGKGGPELTSDFFRFSGHDANCPNPNHGLWLYSQMVRWGQVRFDERHLETVRNVFSNRLYSRALGLAPLEDGPGDQSTRFFDGRSFDPLAVEAYVLGFDIHS